MTTDMQLLSPAQMLNLGTVTLEIERYELKLECPVAKQMLCTGEPRWTVLGAYPCVLHVHGRIAAESAAQLIGMLHAALRQHSTFSFTFLGTAFQNMHLTAEDFRNDDGGHLTEYALSFAGTLGGDA
ncbi:MAG: hypothetical protein IK130_07030 [Oscillospiraceae bacterium]|nr:hypothetical protein [Oscillospiraceae bacterium]